MINKFVSSRSFRLPALLLMVDAVFFGFIDPATSDSFIIIAGCLLLGVSIYCAFSLAARLIGIVLGIPTPSQKRLSFLLSLFVIFLLLMQSIGQLSMRDVIAVLPFMILFYIYVSYISMRKTDGAKTY